MGHELPVCQRHIYSKLDGFTQVHPNLFVQERGLVHTPGPRGLHEMQGTSQEV